VRLSPITFLLPLPFNAGSSNANKRLKRNRPARVVLQSNSAYKDGTTAALRQKDYPLNCPWGRSGTLIILVTYGSRDGARVRRTLELFQHADPDTAQTTLLEDSNA
jgi:hypothetical protein